MSIMLLFLLAAIYREGLTEDKLVKLSVVFRHGQRMPIVFSYPNDPYKNVQFRLPAEMLTEKGARESKDLGTKLRKQYDCFLGEYDAMQYRAISSPLERCIETLTNVTTTLYPSHTQLIPYKYSTPDKLIATHRSCPQIFGDFTKYRIHDEANRRFALLISELTGTDVNSYFEFLGLYDYLKVMEENGYPRPAWAKSLWYELHQMYKKSWNLLIEKQGMNAAGNLLHKIASESSGFKLRVFPKVNLYSGHDLNIVTLLGLLGAYNNRDIDYCSYIAFEIYQTSDDVNYVQIYLDNHGLSRIPIPVPGCEEKCPVCKFLEFAEEYYLAEEWCT